MSIKKQADNFTRKINTIVSTALRFAELQLFLTLFSWPILLYWGIPISIASPVGNLIFGPFIISFLGLSTVIFFCEIFYIPNGLFISFLESISSWWYSISSYSQRSWLVGYPQPSPVYLLLIPIAACLLLHHKKLGSSHKRIIAFLILLGATCGYLRYIRSSLESIITLPCFKKELLIINSSDKHTLIDTGALCSNISSSTWVSYSLIPNLIKKGINKLDHVFMLKPSTTEFKAIKQLCQNFQVNNLYLPKWSGSLNHSGWKAWEELLLTVHEYNIIMHIVDNSPIELQFSQKEKITITPSNFIKRNKIQYRSVSVNCIVDNQEKIITT